MVEFENQPPLDEVDIVMNMIEYKIEEHLSRVEYKMLLMTEVEYQVMENDLTWFFKSMIPGYE